MSDNYIPEEVVFCDVLTRLPVKSLLRFRCVSKSWRAQIDSSRFAREHLVQRGKISEPSDFRIVVGVDSRKLSLPECKKIIKPKRNLISPPEHVTTWCKRRHLPSQGSMMIGSCNGLVCIRLFYAALFEPCNFIFYNPFTQNHWDLPPINKYSPSHPQPSPNRYGYGFGHNSASDDFKLVILDEYRRYEGRTHVQQVSLYSLKSNSWKEVADSPFQGIVLCRDQHNAVFADNSLHWIMRDNKDDSIVITAFELSTEQFHLVPTPPPRSGYDHNNMTVSIGNLGGCLSLLYQDKFQPDFHLWVMKDYGIKDSWAKFTMELPHSRIFPSHLTPLGCFKTPTTNNNDFQQVIFQIDNRRFIKYDFDLKSSMFFTFPSVRDFNACVCFGSLIQPQRKELCGKKDSETMS
ncbi:hypothetical protein ACH5RR_030365 [Cinchona calisaya]|uniref:F-box domain-containing protein n=1 Tax=Cinchona calisaya TaxID=153742 RepID=A0ABD2YVR7_9GENT